MYVRKSDIIIVPYKPVKAGGGKGDTSYSPEQKKRSCYADIESREHIVAIVEYILHYPYPYPYRNAIALKIMKITVFSVKENTVLWE